MIKSSAMLYKPEGLDTEYPELILLMNRLEACEIKNITEEEYNNFTSSLEKAGNTLKSSIDYYYALQEIVNLVYAINLLTPYAYMETDAQFDDDQYKMVIKEINKHFNDNHISQISEDIMDKLVQTEGIQEELLEKMDDLESCLYKIETNYMNLVESLMLKSTFHCLDTATNLIGNSLFIDLTSAENHDKADKKYIETKQDELIRLFTEFFTGKSKEIYRAVVANTINKMPLFFQSSNDVMDYVRNSLEQCRDVAEKKACIDMIKNFWEI
jgi:predicted ribosome quality control (RQC) complex YloA/Tae2 family protein